MYDLLMPKPHQVVIAIDPSIKALGFACFEVNGAKSSLLYSTAIYQAKANSVTAHNRKLEWIDRMDEMANQVIKLSSKYQVRGRTKVVIELPDYRTEAASNTGSLDKLIAMVFTLRAKFESIGCPVNFAPVTVWKGNTPKSITQMRIKRKWGWNGDDHNEADAVGIGSWFISRRVH